MTEPVASTFTFNYTKADRFLRGLATPGGLLQEFPGSNTIYLSDDQQLDYGALVKLGDYSLADEINSTLQAVLGGLYGNFSSTSCAYGSWNAVDVVLGAFMPVPCGALEWDMHSGQDLVLGSNYPGLPGASGFTVKETVWNGSVGSGFADYSDLELCYSINQVHFGDYSGAVSAFEHANSFWDGHGFADRAFQASGEYDSYKLALDLIAFRVLMNDSHTAGRVAAYSSVIAQVQGVMSGLQGSDGGVITNYLIMNGAIQMPPGVLENGETTSLFVLAS